MGMLSLAKKYGCAATEQACAAALELGVSEYSRVRRYLERSQQAPLSLKQVDPLIRELIQYRDLIQQRIHFEEPTHEPDRTQSRLASTALGRHDRSAGNAAAPGAG
jgi:hypothetical protein